MNVHACDCVYICACVVCKCIATCVCVCTGCYNDHFIIILCVLVLLNYYHCRTRYREISRVHCRYCLRVLVNNAGGNERVMFLGITFYMQW